MIKLAQFPYKNDYWHHYLFGRLMDASTAAAATLAVQLAVALIMAGTFYASSGERCTRYWALSGLLSALGVLVVIVNGGAPRLMLSTVGNSAIIAGMVLQWWGLRAFYGKERSPLGWIIIAGFFLWFAYSFVAEHALRSRALLASVTMTAVFVLNLVELLSKRSARASFAGMLACSAALVSAAAFITRGVGVYQNDPLFLPDTAGGIGVVIVYLVPMVTTLLFAMALMLLYFERLISDKHRMATQDELTGLYNRRAIVSAGQREIDVAQRLRRPLSVAYIDIDHFKRINDELGHDAGDHVITEIGHLLKDSCRNIDIVGRYGGEEFCIIFPGMDREGVSTLAERMLASVRRYRFRGQFPVTLSMGFTVLSPEDQERSWTVLMQNADKLLYKAKSEGRDRYCI
ncbi:diguanylate cyclase (GGDEF) domain-containing protein [Noviherbaspirillum suwonense]|jgi:diguanylate cyclase (GGDEF)-like protein|uniref:diguanylate cyclase n=2 Tax=Noviherbaspirillum suwonense TaxID=1224511 RepID=A0ABY1QK72_9BURK|nr:diguanylate cyclase (GGDEF) domain-containing protein [Noviherbaspirillum suwonense]